MLTQILKFLGGLGFFFFGMSYLEQAVSSFSNGKFKKFLKKFTSTPLKAFGSGILVTSILQSSNVVSILVLAFVGAGILALKSALAIILGSNVGTLITASILGVVGMSLNVSTLALPLIFIGAIGMNFCSKWDKIISISKFCLSLGIIFLAFSFMKEGVEFMTDFDLSSFSSLNPRLFYLFGIGITILVQSGTIIYIICLAAISTGILTPDLILPILLGSYLGATITIIVGAFGGNSSAIKKQVAAWHVGFNLITSLIGMLGLSILIKIYNFEISSGISQIIGITSIYLGRRTIFALIFIPLISPISILLQKIIKGTNQTFTMAVQNIFDVNNVDPSIVILAIKQDIHLLFRYAIKYNLSVRDFSISNIDNNASTEKKIENTLNIKGKIEKNEVAKIYSDMKFIQNSLIEFISSLPTSEKSKENTELYQCVLAITDSCKTVKEIGRHIEERKRSSSDYLQKDYNNMTQLVLVFYSAVFHIYLHFDSKKALSNLQTALKTIQTENDDYLAELHPHKNDDISLSNLIQTRRHFMQSCKELLRAIENFNLTSDEVKHFKENMIHYMK